MSTTHSVERGSWYSQNEETSLETIRRILHDPPPTPSVAGWLYPYSTTTIFGEPDAGKSLLLAATTARIIHDGGEVLWVDYEMGEPRTIRRLLSFDLTEHQIAKQIHRVHYPIGPPPDELIDNYAGITAAFFDGFTGLLGAYDGSSNSDVDVDKVYTQLLRPLAATGTSVTTLDHVTKDKENRGRWAIGSQRKIGAPDLAYVFDAVNKFKPSHGGRARLRSSRDRDGILEIIEFHLNGDMTWRLEDTSATGGFTARYTGFMERISIYLEGSSTPVSGAHIERDIKGANGPRRAALKTLIDEQFIRAVPGSRNSYEHTSIKPYREATDTQNTTTPPTSPELASSPPRRGGKTTSPSSPPLRSREGDAGGEVDPTHNHPNGSTPPNNLEPPEFIFYDDIDHTWGGPDERPE